MTDISDIPTHIGFIMDGNGRWATAKGMPRKFGHEAGARTFENIVESCRDLGIRYATFYAFSTENKSRPKDEIDALMLLFDRYADDIFRRIKNGETKTYENVRIRFVGDLSYFSEKRRKSISDIENINSDKEIRLTVCIALNYGGRNEIVNAVNRFISENPGKTVSEQSISENLYAPDVPDPDLIIRTAGEMRLSNFLLWQSAYAEFYATPVFWPDFSENDLKMAIESFSKRTRKFGGISK
jgi:undecaprenyl diphosphate synthase